MRELEASRDSVAAQLEDSRQTVSKLELEIQSTGKEITVLYEKAGKAKTDAEQLMADLAQQKEAKEAADAEATKTQKKLDIATKNLETANLRLKELESYSFPLHEIKPEKM